MLRPDPVGLITGLFPPSCVLCGSCVDRDRAPVCRRCWSRLPRAVPPLCRCCGAPGPRFLDGLTACPECVEWPEDLAAVRAPFVMRAGAARLVRALKYAGWTDLARRMGAAMAPAGRAVAGRSAESSAPRLVPVPLSAPRLRRRGFNQAARLARWLGREVGWPVSDALERVGRGRRQARLGGASRRENVRGRFRAAPPPDEPEAVIVDDVVTTGSTAGACAEALRRVGWRPLGAVAFARAVSAPPPAAVPRVEGRPAD